jgi:NADH:ubiquinone oxidoreductase subunit 6 (chain J)
VYVGAVMTLFLFVVMMLAVDAEATRAHLFRLLPLGSLIAGGMVFFFFRNSIDWSPTLQDTLSMVPTGDMSNTMQIGSVLYTDYVIPFELAAVILLIAMVAAITLVHQNRSRSKRQDIRAQIMTEASTRVRLVAGGTPWTRTETPS